VKGNKDSMDFTFENYKNILLELKKDFIFRHFDDYHEKGAIYLRHDVDVFPENIAAISDIEMECGIRSTFFVLFDSEFYNVLTPRILKILSTVAQNGFAIGLHVDASQFHSLEDLTLDIIQKYEYFRNYIPLQRIVSFHRPMKELFTNIIIPDFINTYEDRFFRTIRYYSDSNHRAFYEILIPDIALDSSSSIQLVTHPFWWSVENLDPETLAFRLESMHRRKLEESLANNIGLYSGFFGQENGRLR